jgi:hypothetical protein
MHAPCLSAFGSASPHATRRETVVSQSCRTRTHRFEVLYGGSVSTDHPDAGTGKARKRNHAQQQRARQRRHTAQHQQRDRRRAQ